ncbi:response regulator [Azospirillum agricola]|uniref:hypothetical protein n=1 Tax=Azospirillum agricola TaxID=1720247 RepID=UPI000A0F21D8|nr:hypothetical protein [Azospirillum agricola]SMH47920.1 hypothetical protein SAMN02982994_2693 [Azospirillum lipoferum]
MPTAIRSFIRLLFAGVLAGTSHEAIQAADGAEALARLSRDVGAIVTDVMMPKMTGAIG